MAPTFTHSKLPIFEEAETDRSKKKVTKSSRVARENSLNLADVILVGMWFPEDYLTEVIISRGPSKTDGIEL